MTNPRRVFLGPSQLLLRAHNGEREKPGDTHYPPPSGGGCSRTRSIIRPVILRLLKSATDRVFKERERDLWNLEVIFRFVYEYNVNFKLSLSTLEI